MLFLYVPSCLTPAASFISRCTYRMVWPSLEETLLNTAPLAVRLEFRMRYLKVLLCSWFLAILYQVDIVPKFTMIDYSMEPAAPVPKFKSISLTGRAADCWLPTSLNVTQRCVFLSVLVACFTNHLSQAEDISVHGVQYTCGEGYFVLRNTCKWSIMSSIVYNHYFMEIQSRFHVVHLLFFYWFFLNPCRRNFVRSVLLFRI